MYLDISRIMPYPVHAGEIKRHLPMSLVELIDARCEISLAV